MTRARALPAGRHVVYRLAPDLLLVFKPRGHTETAHAHPYRQRLRVLRGTLIVRIGKHTRTLKPGSRPLTLAADRPHETRALEPTWLSAESL